jgi:futalosine hydrolase
VEPITTALLCSVLPECELLRERLEGAAEVAVGGRAGWTGRLEGCDVLLVPCGMGKTNAAQALTAVLETSGAAAVVGFGIGGAFPGSGLRVGDVALSTACAYGDEGVDAPGGWLSTEGIGIPLWDGRYNVFPADAGWARRTAAALEEGGRTVRCGTLLTVSACSGTAAAAATMVARFPGALTEGMEGAALAHVALVYGVPFLEARGVSNVVEDRDPARWRIPDGAGAAQQAVLHALRVRTPG